MSPDKNFKFKTALKPVKFASKISSFYTRQVIEMLDPYKPHLDISGYTTNKLLSYFWAPIPDPSVIGRSLPLS